MCVCLKEEQDRRKEQMPMATTLSSLVKLPKLSPKQSKYHNHQTIVQSKLTQEKILSCVDSQKENQKHLPKTLLVSVDTFAKQLKSSSLPLTALTLPFFLDSKDAIAAGGEFGILEGRTFALIHPLVMGGLFVYTLWAGYLGWQWRRVRTVQDEINELKKQVKPIPVTPDGVPTEPPKPTPINTKIQQLTEERKELIKGGYKDKHFNAGSILLGFGVLEAIGGGVNTWLRTGKLFPGPHLFAGAGITVLWAAAAALVPAMQKGNDTARSLHIALNTVNVLLFVWQIPTGLEIVLKVFEFTKWP